MEHSTRKKDAFVACETGSGVIAVKVEALKRSVANNHESPSVSERKLPHQISLLLFSAAEKKNMSRKRKEVRRNFRISF